MIKQNNVVYISYEVKDADTGEILDSNLDGEPVGFLLGFGHVIDGLEENVIGAEVGDKLDFVVDPTKAYGVHLSELVREVDRSHFGDIRLEKGMTLFGKSDDGASTQVVVADIIDDTVLIDYNHPLAGKSLSFSVEILDSREATQQEIEDGFIPRHGGNGGGCCGGGCGCGH